MRPLETLLHCILLIAIIATLRSAPSGSWLIIIVLGSVAIAFAHLSIERFRWQMIPAYSLVATCAGWFLLPVPAMFAAPVTLALLAVWLLGLLFCIAYPVFRLPKPTGKYCVGTQIRYFSSETRLDPFGEDTKTMRELMLQVWYPADPLTGASRASYRPAKSVTFRNGRFALAKTNSRLDAPFVSGETRHPILLFVPSWRGQRQECTALAEEFSSRGYVVIGIDHPSLSQRVVLPDGRIRLAVDMPGEDYSSDAALKAFVTSAEFQVSVRLADVREVLDLVERWAENDSGQIFTHRLDTNHTGICGFSIGGSTACEACGVETRLRAGLNLGGLVVGKCLTSGPQKPFLFIFDDDPAINPVNLDHQDSARRRAAAFGAAQVTAMCQMLERHGGYWLRIPGTTHSDLSDVPFFSPFRWIRKGGRANRKYVWQIIRSTSVEFFEQHLKSNVSIPFVSFATIFPDVELRPFSCAMHSVKGETDLNDESTN